MFLTIKPLFPVVVVSLGNDSSESQTVTANGKQIKKSTVKHYFGVFTIKTPNKMFLLTSETGDNLTVPKLVDLLKLPSLTLDGLSLDVSLPKTVITTLVDWFNAPLNEIDGVSPYQLASYGMINDTLFADTIKRVLSPALAANQLTLESIDNTAIMRQIHLTRATALGTHGDHTPLGDRLSNYLNTVSANKKLADQQDNKVNLPAMVKTESKDVPPTIRKPVSEIDVPSVDVPSVDVPPVDVPKVNKPNKLEDKFLNNPLGMVKRELQTYARQLGLEDKLGKKDSNQTLITMIEEHLTSTLMPTK